MNQNCYGPDIGYGDMVTDDRSCDSGDAVIMIILVMVMTRMVDETSDKVEWETISHQLEPFGIDTKYKI